MVKFKLDFVHTVRHIVIIKKW